MKHNEVKRPRVLHICSDTNIGGAGRYVLTLLAQPRLTERFTVALACPEGALAAEARRAGLTVLTYPGADTSFSWQALRALIFVLRQWNPRIVHTHGSLAGRVAGVLSGARVIYTKHGLASVDEQSVQVRSPGGLLRRASVSLFSHRIVAVSEAVQQSLVAAGAAPGRVRVIPGGVDVQAYDQVGPLVPGVIGALGRLEREKGFDLLLEAMAQLTGDLLLGGEGLQRAALIQQVVDLGLKERVQMSGFVPDVPSFLSQIGLFVLPSRSEGLGLVLIEAMAAGRPVVATRVGGVPEVVIDQETGILVPPAQPGALAEAIRHLLADPALCARMGRAGRERVTQHFSADRMAERSIALYEELIGT